MATSGKRLHQEDYYALLDGVRRDGDWEAWLAFFLNGVAQTAEEAVSTAQRLLSLFEDDRAKAQQTGRERVRHYASTRYCRNARLRRSKNLPPTRSCPFRRHLQEQKYSNGWESFEN